MGGRRLTATARKFNNYKGDGVFSRHRHSELSLESGVSNVCMANCYFAGIF